MENAELPPNMSLDATQQKQFNKKIKQIKDKVEDKFASNNTGVIYIGHIPQGFFEPQMKKYFSQFGKVNKLRVARSKKTGNIKGYAFVEFKSEAVAQIVADTMNNYLMFHKLLKCQYLPLHKVHPDTFKGSNRLFKKPKAHLMAINRHNSPKTVGQEKAAAKRAITRKTKKLEKLADMGIDFSFPGQIDIKAKPSQDESTLGSDGEEAMPMDRSLEDLATEAVTILYDDSTEDDISFATPPGSMRRKLDKSTANITDSDSEDDLPVQKKAKKLRSAKKSTPKSTAKSVSSVKKSKQTPKSNVKKVASEKKVTKQEKTQAKLSSVKQVKDGRIRAQKVKGRKKAKGKKAK